jgi:hypothetical protein
MVVSYAHNIFWSPGNCCEIERFLGRLYIPYPKVLLIKKPLLSSLEG